METFAFLQLALIPETSEDAVPRSADKNWVPWHHRLLKRPFHCLPSTVVKALCLALVVGLSDWTISPALAGILQAGQTLKFGDSGLLVERLQERLRSEGFYPGVATGNYLQQTADAVTRYQRSIGLEADGIFGAATDAALFDGLLSGATLQSATPSVSNVSDRTYALGERLLRRGDVGPDVRELQELINARFTPLSVDGDFGPSTEAVVLGFQEFNGFSADGVVGPTTLAALRARPIGQVSSAQQATTAVVPGRRVETPPLATVSTFEVRRANENAQQINRGRYRVIIPTGSENVEKLASTRGVVSGACIARSRRGSYIFAGGYPTYGEAESVQLALQSRRVRRDDTNAPRLDARVDYTRGDFRNLECLR